MVREWKGNRVGVRYGYGGGGADDVKGVAFGMGGEVNVLGELKAVEKRGCRKSIEHWADRCGC